MDAKPSTSLIDVRDLLDDQTIFMRTAAGQRELIAGTSHFISRDERQLLAVVTGLTPLRVLLDIVSLGDPVPAITRLVKEGLIEKVHPPVQDRSILRKASGWIV